MKKLLVFVVWCAVLLIGVVLVTFSPHSWECPKDKAYLDTQVNSQGTTILTARADGEISLWTPNGDLIDTLNTVGNPDGRQTQITVSTDQTRMLTVSDYGSVRLWDFQTGLIL